jgi:hypothetical protein
LLKGVFSASKSARLARAGVGVEFNPGNQPTAAEVFGPRLFYCETDSLAVVDRRKISGERLVNV